MIFDYKILIINLMPGLDQKGIVSLLVILILLCGVVAGVYLVQQRTNLFPQAAKKSSYDTTQSDNSKSIKIKSDAVKRIKEANDKLLKSIKDKNDELFIAGSVELSKAHIYLKGELRDLKKSKKDTSKLKKLQEIDKRTSKTVLVAYKYIQGLKDKTKVEKFASETKQNKEKSIKDFESLLKTQNYKSLPEADKKALDASINSGIADAQKDTAKKKLSKKTNSLVLAVINKLTGKVYAQQNSDITQAQQDYFRATQKYIEATNRQELAYLDIEGRNLPLTDPLVGEYFDRSSEAYQAGYDVGYAYGETYGLQAAQEQAAQLESQNELTQAQIGVLAGLNAYINENTPEGGPTGPATNEQPGSPPDPGSTSYDERDDTFGGQKEEDRSGFDTGSDNPGTAN